MTKLKLCGTILLALIAVTLRANDDVQPIGIYVDSADAEESGVKVTANVIRDGAEVVETVDARATVNRDGKDYAIFQGMEVFPGDVVSTPVGGGIIVAYLNDNVIQLDESSRLTIGGGTKTTGDFNSITLNSGRAGVAARTTLSQTLNVDMGEPGQSYARVARAGPKPAAFTLITKAKTGGGFETTVYCTAGSVVLTPVNGTTVKIADGLALAVNLIQVNTSVTNAATTVTAAKFDKNNAVGAVANTSVKVGKGGVVSFKSTIINGDNSISKGSFTTTAGVVTKTSWKTGGANKFSVSWSESTKKGVTSIKVSQKFDGNAFSGAFVNGAGTAGKAKVTVGATKQTYGGTATYDPATGKITFVTTKVSKDGGSATFTFDPIANGGAQAQQSIIVTPSGGVAGTPIVHNTPYAAPGASTPDGRIVTQNQIPKSQ